MKTYIECVPCIVEQAVEAPRRFTGDEQLIERVVKRTIAELVDFDFARSPPEMGGVLHRIMSDELGDEDPYLEDKRRANRLAIELLPELRRFVESADDPFEAAVRLAIAGNVIDFGAPGGLRDDRIELAFRDTADVLLRGDGAAGVERLRRQAARAERILFLADNAGEIVVDRLLIERFPRGSVTVVVRSGPAINDALLEDAEQAGLGEVAEVIESGADLPGTPLAFCSADLRERFAAADLVVSKGQGNYETLSDEQRRMFFLLRAKCPVVAGHMSCEVGDYAVAEFPRSER
ncbi:MAG: ARMT1-like domain-containing protein [Polyangia bacterium]